MALKHFWKFSTGGNAYVLTSSRENRKLAADNLAQPSKLQTIGFNVVLVSSEILIVVLLVHKAIYRGTIS